MTQTHEKPEIGELIQGSDGQYYIVVELGFGDPARMLCNPNGMVNTTAGPYWVDRPSKLLMSVKMWSLKTQLIKTMAFPLDHFWIYFSKL